MTSNDEAHFAVSQDAVVRVEKAEARRTEAGPWAALAYESDRSPEEADRGHRFGGQKSNIQRFCAENTDSHMNMPDMLAFLAENWQSLPSFAMRGRLMPDEILTLPEVAQLLKVAEKTVYSMAQKSQLPAFKVGGQWRFQRVDIDRWIEQQKANARDEGER